MSDAAGVSVISNICENSRDSNRAKILEWEAVAKELDQVDIPVLSTLHGEMYAREIIIPKGTVLTGDIYKFDHFDIMVSGDITVSTDSDEPFRLKGFNFLKGMAGKKRAGYAHEDTRWITIHPYTGADGDEVQETITAKSFEELERFYIDVNNYDYLSLVSEIGISHEEISKQVLNEEDMLDKDHDLNSCKGVEVKASKIDGEGVFASTNFAAGDVLCCARLDLCRTKFGRFSNHALFANAKLVFESNRLLFVAKKPIFAGEEITVNYRDLLKTRFKEGDLCQE